MKRWAFNFAAGVSLVLWLAVMVIWVRSYFVSDTIEWQKGQVTGPRGSEVSEYRSVSIWSNWGVMNFQSSTYHGRAFMNGTGPFQGSEIVWRKEEAEKGMHWPNWGNATTSIRAIGFSFDYWNSDALTGAGSIIDRHAQATVPMWGFFVFASLPLAFWFVRFRSSRRALHSSLCSICGYDLRATPDRCPECGTISTKAKGAAT